MKKKFMLAVAAVLVGVFASTAGVNITKVDKVSPNDEMFMDMAVSVAKTAKKPIGAVVVLNGALRSQGTATATATAEENAIKSSRRKSLYGGSIYTIIQPTTEAYNAICRSGADAVYFAVPAADAVSAGVYSIEDYDTSKADTTLTQVPLKHLPYADATLLVVKYKK